MSNNYHRHLPPTSGTKATRLNEHSHSNSSSSTRLNQLSVAAAMMSAGVTDPAAYRAFLNSQAAAMINKHKQQTVPPPSTSFTHELGLPVPKKLAVGTDRYKQQQHAEWLLSSYRQQSQSYNGNRHHQPPSGPNKMMVNQQRSTYIQPTPQLSNTRVNSDMNSLSPSLQRRVSSPPTYSSAAAAAAVQNKLIAQTKFWQAAVQAAAQAQQQFHHHQQQQQQTPANSINELQNYINHSNTTNGKISSYANPETHKILPTNNSHDEQHHYTNNPRFKLMRASYPNTASASMPSACHVRQRMNPTNSSTFTPQQQQIDMITAAYQNYRRRSSGFSSTTSHGGPSDDESDEYIPPRKDSVGKKVNFNVCHFHISENRFLILTLLSIFLVNVECLKWV
jgi:hypothetical protein